MKILTVVGARPQFVKAAPVSRILRKDHDEVLVHTGQHYDEQMSEVFFRELEIPAPEYNLGVGSAGHSAQTGEILIRIEPIIEKEKPDWMLVYGDTNSTLAGALAASKLHIPVAHVEAGLRSFNREMPEEINRVLTDHISTLLFCPAFKAVENLKQEGIYDGVHVVGDVMYDAYLGYSEKAAERSSIIRKMHLESKGYLLATLHRASNVDDPRRLMNIIETFSMLNEVVVFPVHPRTLKTIQAENIPSTGNVRFIDPVGYIDMLWLEKNARMILTDSGGMQKEAYWSMVPCITLRDETEWVETIQAGWNMTVGSDRTRILDAIKNFIIPETHPNLFGDGKSALKIANLLIETNI